MTAPTEDVPASTVATPGAPASAPAGDAPASSAAAPAITPDGAFIEFLDLGAPAARTAGEAAPAPTDTPSTGAPSTGTDAASASGRSTGTTAAPATTEPSGSGTGGSGTGAPPRRRSLWWRIGYPVALVALIASIPVLLYAGYKVVLQSNNGRLIFSTTDPAEPGWEAAVEPTPTGVLATLTDQGALSSVTVVALTGDGIGSVIFVPADTQVPGAPNYGTMVDAWAQGGAVGLKSALEAVMGVDVGDVTPVTSANWEELVAPIGTVTVANPDNVEVAGQQLPRGSVDLAPAQVANYLRARNYAEDDTNRLLRQQAFWQAWLARIAATGSVDAVPGESDTGVGRFIRTLAGEQVTYSVLPVRVQARPDAYAGVFVPITDQVNALVARAVPFPTAAPPGSRPRVRVLDGTGDLDHGVGAARTLAANGGQIDGIGNASSFDVPTTQLIISDESMRQAAERLKEALGVGEIVTSADASDSVDITVILGADARDVPAARGLGSGPVDSSGDGSGDGSADGDGADTGTSGG